MQELIDKYLDNLLSVEEKLQFEKDLLTNSELAQELELEQIVRNAVVDNSLLEWKEDVSQTISKKRKSRKLKKTMFITATVLSLASVLGLAISGVDLDDTNSITKNNKGNVISDVSSNDSGEVEQNSLALAGVDVITIPDAEFVNCLRDNYPDLLNDEDELITANASALTGDLTCNTGDIVDITGIQYFTSIDEFNFKGNEIVDITPLAGLDNLKMIDLENNDLEIVPDLSGFINLTVFKASNNQLDNLPVFPSSLEVLTAGNNSLSDTLDITTLTNLTQFSVFENDVKGIKGLGANVNLELLDLRENDLASLPDLSLLSKLRIVDLSENRFPELPGFDLQSIEQFSVGSNKLTFDDFIILAESDLFPASFPDIQNQAIPIKPLVDTVVEGEFWDWVLSIDKTVTTSTYYWYKDGEPFDTTTSVHLEIDALELANSGVFHCEIVNSTPGLEGFRIVTNTRTLVVEEAPFIPCFTVSNVVYDVNTEACSEESSVSINLDVEGTSQGVVNYELNGEILTTPGLFSLDTEGVYNLVLYDDECRVEITETFEVVFDTAGCNPKEECFTVADVVFDVNTISCSEISFVTTSLEVNGVVKGNMNYELNGEALDTPSSFTLDSEGEYELVLYDDVCRVEVEEQFEVIFDNDNCEPKSFSPNGDNNEDVFYIETTGLTKVYDKSGKLLKTVEGPGLWDGTDENGTVLPIGHYILIDESGKRVGVTLVK